MEIKGDLGDYLSSLVSFYTRWMMKLVREIVAVLVFWVVVEIWCDFGGWEMVMVAIERRNANDGVAEIDFSFVFFCYSHQ
ncbi:hypothetical protein MKX03_034431 [Papaver bracteatum]|nr:hypothetical protein MKX03_034431 [Papaver bracteatum]